MKHACPLLLVCLLLFPAIAAPATQTTEIQTAATGTLEARTVSLAPGEPLLPCAETAPLPVSNRDGEIVWVDYNSQEAVAENVAVSGDGSYAVAGWWLNHKRVAFYDITQGNVPRWTQSMVAAFQIPVDMSLQGAYTLGTGRGDPLYVFQPSGPPALYTDNYTPPLVGYECAISQTGNTYAAAAGNPAGGSGEVRVYDGAGALRFVKALPQPPEGLSVSADGEFVAANIRTFAKVWSATTGELRDSIPIPGETQATAVLSGNGEYLATGGFNRTLNLYRWNGTEYALAWSYMIPGTTWIVALAVSADGSTVAAGTWTNANGGRVVLFSTASSTPLWVDASFGDEVHAVALTADGSKVVAASYGRYGGTVGNIVSVYDRSSATPIFGVGDDAMVNVGSAMAIDIGEDGGYVFVGGKRVHAREMGSGGWTMAIRLTDPAAVEETPRFAPALVATPNPFRGQVTLDFGRPGGAEPRQILIYQADGRLAGKVMASPGCASAAWDGRDATGRPLPAGVYLLRTAREAVRVVKTE